MIQLIEGPPGSGKSYFAVNYLCKFVSYDGLYNEYTLAADTLIISNIEGLRINHWLLDDCLKDRTLQEFFSITNFERIGEKTGKQRIVLVIDEVHDYFPDGYKDKDIYSFFAYHRHIGLDIILMTQSLASTTRMFNPLVEYIVKVKPRSRAILNSFSYSFVDKQGKFLYSKAIAKKPVVFGAYKSFRKDEHNKPKNAVRHWIVISLVFFVVAGFMFKGALAVVKGKSTEGAKKSAQVEIDKQRMVNVGNQKTAPAGVSSNAVAAAAPAPGQAAFANHSTVQAFPSYTKSALYVTGIAQGDGRQALLLSDGRTVKSRRQYKVGDDYP